MLGLELGEALMPAVAGVDVEHEQARGDPGADVGLRPPGPPAPDLGGVAGGGVQAVAQLAGAAGRAVGPVAGRARLTQWAVAAGELAAQRENLVAGGGVGQRGVAEPGRCPAVAVGSAGHAAARSRLATTRVKTQLITGGVTALPYWATCSSLVPVTW